MPRLRPATPPRTLPVLVIDDDPAGRYATARALRAGGFETVESLGGAQGLEMAAQGVLAVVLDVHLPDLSGLEVCRLLRSNPLTARLPVIQVSAVHVSPDDQAAGLRTGADAYLVRPVASAVLVAMVETLLRARAQAPAPVADEQLYQGIFDRADTGLALLDRKGRFIEANPTLLAMLDRSREQLVGRLLAGLVPREWRDRIEAGLARWDAPPWRETFPVLTADAVRREFAWTVTGHTQDGLFVAAVGDPSARP